MFNFIKKLFGVKTPVTTAAQAPYKVEPQQPKVEVAVAEPTPAVQAKAPVASAPAAQAPAKKNRRPRNRKPKAATAQAKPAVTEGKAKGGNGAVKKQKANGRKPKAPTPVKAK